MYLFEDLPPHPPLSYTDHLHSYARGAITTPSTGAQAPTPPPLPCLSPHTRHPHFLQHPIRRHASRDHNNTHGHEDAADNELGFSPVYQHMLFSFHFIFSPLVAAVPRSSNHPHLSSTCKSASHYPPLKPHNSLPLPPRCMPACGCCLHPSPHASQVPPPPRHCSQDPPRCHAIMACKSSCAKIPPQPPQHGVQAPPTRCNATPTQRARPTNPPQFHPSTARKPYHATI